MKYALAIHEIMAATVTAPGTVVELDDKAYGEMLALGAARAATDDEIALYRLSRGETLAAAPPAPLEPAKTVREALEARAKELGIKFQKNTADETIAARIADVEGAPQAVTPADPDEVEAL